MIQEKLEKQFGAVIDVPISFWVPSLGKADAMFEKDGYDVAIHFVKEDDTKENLVEFFDVCRTDKVCPLFLFRYPNKSNLAVICSYLNTAAFAIDDDLRITPFIVTSNGVEVATETVSFDDFELRRKYFFNSDRSIFGFEIPKESLPLYYLNKALEFRVLEEKKANSKRSYDESELENLFCSCEYEKLFSKLYPVIRYGLNKALEFHFCDEDMVQDVCEIIWKKIDQREIRNPNSIGAFTISVCRNYVRNMIRKQTGRRKIEEKFLFKLI